MATAIFLLTHRRSESPVFDAIFGAVLLSFVAAMILWERKYRRAWIQFRARNWRQTTGTFDEGDIVRMMKGRSKQVAGYQVWMAYDYECEGEQVGIYTLPFWKYEFSTEEEAEECRKAVANQSVTVRVSPRNPKRSRVLDEDVKHLVPEAK